MITAITALCTGGVGAIVGPFLAGFAIGMNTIQAWDRQGEPPYQYVEIWIPQDPINEAAMHFLCYCWFRTTNYWWHAYFGYCAIIGPA